MTAGIDSHFAVLAAASDECRRRTLESHQVALGEVQQGDADFADWLEHLEGPTIPLMQAARRELALAEYSAASGLYRQSFASLRLFLELNFAAVYFSVNEFERRKWVADRYDFSWSAALSPDTGVLSASFVTEFAPELISEAKHYSESAQNCYRYCSQLIHGKHKDSQRLPVTLEYSADILSEWCSQAKRAIVAVLFLLYIRYGDVLDLHPDHSIHPVLLSHFGHIEPIRNCLGVAKPYEP